MARVEQSRREWERFEREDQPAFARWMAATFGSLLTRLRDLEARMHEKESLVTMVEMETMLTGDSPQRAYERIMKSRANPPPEVEAGQDREQTSAPPGDEESERPETPEEQREAFEEVLRLFMGIDPSELNPAEYDRMFQDFKQEVFEDPGREDVPFPARPTRAPPPKDARVKELYRALVRRLHPDSRADNDPTVSALWHDVQDAYQAGNLDRLEMLLALTDLQSNQTGPQTSLSQLKAALAELNRSLRALQKSLRAARREHAWNFARTSDHSDLRERVRGELQSSEAELQDRLNHLEQVLALMSAPPGGRRRRPRRAERFQEDLFF